MDHKWLAKGHRYTWGQASKQRTCRRPHWVEGCSSPFNFGDESINPPNYALCYLLLSLSRRIAPHQNKSAVLYTQQRTGRKSQVTVWNNGVDTSYERDCELQQPFPVRIITLKKKKEFPSSGNDLEERNHSVVHTQSTNSFASLTDGERPWNCHWRPANGVFSLLFINASIGWRTSTKDQPQRCHVSLLIPHHFSFCF